MRYILLLLRYTCTCSAHFFINTHPKCMCTPPPIPPTHSHTSPPPTHTHTCTYQHKQEENLLFLCADHIHRQQTAIIRKRLLVFLSFRKTQSERLEPCSSITQLLSHNLTLGEEGRQVGQIVRVYLNGCSTREGGTRSAVKENDVLAFLSSIV